MFQRVATGLLAGLGVFAAAAAGDDPCRDGAAALDRRDLAAAERLLRECAASEAADVDAYLRLAAVHQLRRNEEKLYETAVAGMRRFPNEIRFYLTAGVGEARRGRYEQAIRTLEAARLRRLDDERVRPALANALFARGVERLNAGLDEAAADDLGRAAALNPNDVEIQLNLGRALHNMLRPAEAVAAFDRVLAMQPETPLARFHRGLALYALGEFESAVADLDRQIATDPDYPPAYLVRGLALLETPRWKEAEADLATAVDRLPENPRAWLGLGRARLRAERFEQAETALRRAVAADPADPAPLNALVVALLRLGRAEEAAPLRRRSAELARGRRSADSGEIRFKGAEPSRR